MAQILVFGGYFLQQSIKSRIGYYAVSRADVRFRIDWHASGIREQFVPEHADAVIDCIDQRSELWHR